MGMVINFTGSFIRTKRSQLTAITRKLTVATRKASIRPIVKRPERPDPASCMIRAARPGAVSRNTAVCTSIGTADNRSAAPRLPKPRLTEWVNILTASKRVYRLPAGVRDAATKAADYLPLPLVTTAVKPYSGGKFEGDTA